MRIATSDEVKSSAFTADEPSADEISKNQANPWANGARKALQHSRKVHADLNIR